MTPWLLAEVLRTRDPESREADVLEAQFAAAKEMMDNGASEG